MAEAAGPDLVVTSVTSSPAAPATGDQVTFMALIKNRGTTPTPSGVVLGVIFKVDAVKETTWADTLVGPLAPGASVRVAANGGSAGATWKATAGKHAVVAYVDDVNRVSESIETNNKRTMNFTVGAPALHPDLILTGVTCEPVEPRVGDAVRFRAIVKNQGAKATPSGTILGVLFEVEDGSVYWSDSKTTSLKAGASVTLTANGGTEGTGTWLATGGAHGVTAYVDDVDRIKGETSETNNTMAMVFTVSEAPVDVPPEPIEGVITAKGEADQPAAEQRLAYDPNTLWMGTFTAEDWKKRWGIVIFKNPGGNTVGTQSFAVNGKVLKTVASSSNDGFTGYGSDFRPGFKDMEIEAQDEVYFRYVVYFPADFDWYEGGKLPGLSGISPGETAFSTSGGGDYHPTSWSGRTMWRTGGRMSSYLYVKHANGINILDHKNPNNGRVYGINPFWYHGGVQSKGFQYLKKGAWNLVELHYKMNTPGKNDGLFEGRMNGELGLRLTDVQYRDAAHPKLNINQMFFTSFFGGPTSNKTTETWYFDDVVIALVPIGPRQ